METYLTQLIDVVNRKRILIERECNLLQDLLRPWTIQKTSHPPPDVQKKITDDSSNDCPKLSEVEAQALKQVDRLLAKAERAMHLKAKRLKNEPKDDDKESSAVTTPASDGNEDSSSASKPSEEHPKPSTKPLAKTKAISPSEEKPKHATKPASKSKASSHATSKPLGSQQKKSLVERNNSASSNLTSARPASGVNSSRPSSRNRRTPVHMTAPFKTDANIRVPHRMAQQAVKNQMKAPRAKVESRLGLPAFKSLPKIHSKPKCPVSTVAGLSQRTKTTDVTPHVQDERLPVEERINEIEIDTNKSPDVTEDSGRNSPCIIDENVTTQEHDGVSDSNDLTEKMERIRISKAPPLATSSTEPQVFDLRKDGSSLTVPGKLRKMLSTNFSLRDRCKSSRIIKKVTAVDPAENFMRRLESQSEISPELKARVGALTCFKRHEMLLETFNSLCLQGISETSKTEEIYRTKAVLEFVLSKFAELEDQANYFSRVQFREIQEQDDSPRVKKLFYSKDNMDWFEVPILTEEVAQGDTPNRLGTFDRQVSESLSSNPLWCHLKFTEQHLQAQIQLINVVWSHWKDLLNQPDRNSTELQLLYGLMTTCGQYFPAFIESIQDL